MEGERLANFPMEKGSTHVTFPSLTRKDDMNRLSGCQGEVHLVLAHKGQNLLQKKNGVKGGEKGVDSKKQI